MQQNFLANQTIAIFISLCESLVLLVKAHCEYYPQIPLLPWFHGLEAVEHFFGIACQLNSDFDFFDLTQIIPKISQYNKALRAEKLKFAKEKLFVKLIDNSFSPNSSQIFVSIHEEEVSTYSNNQIINFTNNEVQDESNEHNEINISTAINKASCKMKHIATEEYDEEILLTNSFQEGSLQLNIINHPSENYSILYDGDSKFQYGLESSLDLEILLQQRQRYEAYTSRPLERKIKMSSARFNPDITMTIHPNKASHIVAYFSKNENPNLRLVKQREKRWKENHRNISNALAQIHAKELTQSKKYKSIKKPKSFIQMKNNYIFVVYGNQVCVGRVVAVYFEAYGQHCYTDNAITNLDN
ncbi:21300_t:CDS:2, partial [Gigaspora rosea]